MKNGKKLTAVAAASAVASALVAPAAFAATTSFTDISGNFAADAISALAAKGILSGNPDGTFAPNGNITREQFAVVLSKALNLDASGTTTFADVDSWASGYVAAVVKAGIITGYDATHFGGKDNLNREQMATIFVRALTKQNGYDATGKGSKLTFSDASKISSWAKDSVGAAVELGLIHGMTDGTFAPAGNATRAQVALVTQSFLNLQVSLSVTAAATLNSNNTATVTGTAKGGADSVKVTVDGGTAANATLNADGTYTFKTDVLATGNHTVSVVAYKGTTASQPASATVTVATVGVASVKPVDARNIDVVFNTPMDDSQTDVTNFTLANGGTTVNPTSVTWSADGKTASLAFATSFKNNNYYTLTVAQGLLDANMNVLSDTADYNSGFLWNDTTAPTVTGITNTLGGNVKIAFSKPLGTAPTVVLNGTEVTLNAFTDGATSVTVAAANLPSSVTVGSTVNVIITGAEDQADTDGAGTHNAMSLYQGTFTYSLNAVTPVVQSLKASGEDTMTLTFNEAIASNVDGTAVVADGATDNAAALGLVLINSDGTAVVGATATTTDGQTFTITVPNTVYLDGASTATMNVTVKGFEDAGLDVGNVTTQSVTLTQDATAPTLINTTYTSDNKIVFTFSKNITADAAIDSDITVVNNTTGVAYDLTGLVTSATNKVTVDNTGATLPAGTYTFSFAAGSVSDNSLSANGNAAFTKVVTVPTSTSTSGASVSSATATANVITVTYSDAVKGGATTGSATDVNNYKLNGAALPAGSTITLDASQKVATIKLPSGSIASSATEVFNVANVQTLDSVAVKAYTNTIAVVDNTAPKLTGAKVDASGNLVLTFSEDINGVGDENTAVQPVAGDFVVTVNGVSVLVTVAAGADETHLKLTSNGVSFNTGTVVVKTASTTTGADAAGNKLTAGTSVTATR